MDKKTEKKRLVLASTSERRIKILKDAGFIFDVVSPLCGEETDGTLSPSELVMALSKRKAASVLDLVPGAVVLGSDTVVFLDGQILGKPSDEEEAKKMLSFLSGRTHEVLSGICVTDGDREVCDFEISQVVFAPLSKEDIDAYVASQEPMKKAGGYAIQGKGVLFVEKIEGDYLNIVGLPLYKTARILREFSIFPR